MLSESLEKLVSLIQDPAEREAARNELESSTLRLQDYSRQMNDLNAMKRRNQEWYDQYSSEFASMSEEIAKMRQGTTPAEQFINNPPDGSDDGSIAQKALEEARKAKAEADAIKQQLISGNVVTREYLDKYAPERFDQWGSAMFRVLEKANQARNEYGLNVTPEELVKKAGECSGNLDQAYNALTEQARQEKLKADLRKEVEAELKAQFATSAVPLAGSGYSAAANQFEAFMSGADNNGSGIPADLKADNTGRLAAAIAANLRAEGKY